MRTLPHPAHKRLPPFPFLPPKYPRHPLTHSLLHPPTDCHPTRCPVGTRETVPCGGHANRVCESCHSSCMACSGPTSAQCLDCYSGNQLLGTSCVPRLACTYTEWTEWTECTVKCGGGRRTRTRSGTNQWPCYDPLPTADLGTCNTDLCRTYPAPHCVLLPARWTLCGLDAGIAGHATVTGTPPNYCC
jgi:hypothetical protein